MIDLEDLTKVYPGGTVAVDNLTLRIPAGEVCALVGPSGCGKTTTMRMINRLEEPTSGVVRIDGRDVLDVDVQELRRHIGYVIQAAGLFPHYTVEKNVATVCDLLGLPDYSTVDVDKKYQSFQTYRNGGLPDWPIATPSAKSLAATLNPVTKTKNLFFYACPDADTHRFAKTFEQHQRNIARCE